MSEPKKTFIRSIIPAVPGWFVVEHCIGNAEFPDSLTEEPVIAWAVTATFDDDDDRVHRDAQPVTADWSVNDAVLKRPDGTYLRAGDRSFDNAAEVLEYFIAERAERRSKIVSQKK